MKKKNNNGFTLVELLVAIAILGIIMVIALPQISKVQGDNNDTKYQKYAEYVANSSKLYTDSYSKDMFGNNQSGCYDIKYDAMREKNLINDIKVDRTTCASTSGTYVRVFKTGNHYIYEVAVKCTDKNNKVVYEQKLPADACTGNEPDREGPTITLTPDNLNWHTGVGKTVTISVYDNYGLLENAKISYAWVKYGQKDTLTPDKYTQKVFSNKRYEGTSSEPLRLTIPVPQNANGIYQLIVKPEGLRDSNGNYATGIIESNEFKLDTSKPTITTISNPSNGQWQKSPITITVTGNDSISNVSKFVYGYSKTDMSSEDWTTNAPVGTSRTVTKRWDANINKEVFVYAVDAAGNKSDPVSANYVRVDTDTPTCRVVFEGTKGLNNWYKSSVTVKVETDDNYSGILASDVTTSTTPSYNNGNVKAQTDTKGQTWYGYVKDKAGNVGSCSGSVKVDATAPTCSVAFTGTAGTSGWYKSNATATVTTNDSTSGVATYDLTTSSTPTYNNGNSKVQTETKSTTWYGYVKDNAGNIGSCSNAVKVDTTAPTCSVGFTGTKGSNDWYKTDVTVAVTRNDGTSGIASYDLTTSNSASYNNGNNKTQSDTQGATWFGYVKDAAGNVGSCSNSVKVDKTKPTCTVTFAGTAGENGWYKSTVTATVNPYDGTSGVAAYDLSTSNSATYTNGNNKSQGETKGTTYYGYVKDSAGNVGSCSSAVKIDTTAPTCSISYSGTAGSNSWYKSSVTATLNTNDGGSGVGSYDITTSSSVSYNGNKTKTQGDTTGTTHYGYVKDSAGNTGKCNNSVKVDATAPSKPSLSFSGTSATMTSSDGTSGIAKFEYRASGSTGGFTAFGTTGKASITQTVTSAIEIRAVDYAGNASETVLSKHCNTGTLTNSNGNWICTLGATYNSKTCSGTRNCSGCCAYNYPCSNGWYCTTGWAGSQTYCTGWKDCETSYTYDCSYYSCPSGFSLSGTTCSKAAD